jgi:cell division protein FtsB
MNEFKRRQRVKRIIYSRAIFILLVIVCLFFAHAVWGIFWKYHASVEDERQLQAKLASLTRQESSLASSTEALQSPGGIEYALQEKFGAVKSGEKEIVFIDTATSSPPSSAHEGFFARLWQWLTNL